MYEITNLIMFFSLLIDQPSYTSLFTIRGRQIEKRKQCRSLTQPSGPVALSFCIVFFTFSGGWGPSVLRITFFARYPPRTGIGGRTHPVTRRSSQPIVTPLVVCVMHRKIRFTSLNSIYGRESMQFDDCVVTLIMS